METGLVDYDKMEEQVTPVCMLVVRSAVSQLTVMAAQPPLSSRVRCQAMLFRPKLLLCGGSAYPREWDYARLRSIADACGAILFCDMAHIRSLHASRRLQVHLTLSMWLQWSGRG